MGAWEARPIDRLVQIVKPRLSQLRSLDERLGGRLHERRPEQGVHLCAESVPPVLVPPRTRGTVTNTGRQGKGRPPKKNRRQCPALCPGGSSREPISRANCGSDDCRVGARALTFSRVRIRIPQHWSLRVEFDISHLAPVQSRSRLTMPPNSVVAQYCSARLLVTR